MPRIPALGKIERAFACEQNQLAPPPFPVSLPNGGAVNLCSVQVSRDCRDAFLIQALINWSVTFTPLTPPSTEQPAVAGSAQVTFELLRNGSPIFRVIETNEQPALPASNGAVFTTATTSFVTTKLLHIDRPSLLDFKNGFNSFSLRAIGIILTAPLAQITLNPVAAVTAQAGSVTLTVEEVNFRR